jgi:thiamine-monophosphate kinase
MDVSDGLVQDLGHLCRAGSLAAEIMAEAVPLSPQARAARRLALCLTGGDDYELLFAVPDAREAALRQAAGEAGVEVTRIGTFRAGEPRVTVLAADGTDWPIVSGGWSHFG